jgi:uncharacterized phiE125 gp8 family phage protein
MTIRPKVITPPASEPLDVSDMADHLRLGDDASELAYVERLIKAVRVHLEHRLCRAFIKQTLEITLDYWPGWQNIYTTGYQAVELPRAWPLISVDSVSYKTSDGTVIVMDTTGYVVDMDSQPGRIAPPYGSAWPSFIPFPLSAIRIRYTAGNDISDTASPQIPYPDDDILHAMRFLVAHFFEHREAVIVGDTTTIESKQMELAVASLLANHEMPNLF